MNRVSTFIQGFFWFAFAAFLAASIAHVTYFFRAYEPQGDGNDLLWWGVSLAIALSIDITIFLLSITVANLHRGKRAGGLIASVWFFIVGLAALSFYINLKYAQHFASPTMVTPTALSIPNIGTIGDINPFIASLFQVLAIAYTWIADKIVADEKPKSAQELKQEADEFENRVKELTRLTALKRGMKEETGGLIGSLGSTIRRAKKEVLSIVSDDQAEPLKQAETPAQNATAQQAETPAQNATAQLNAQEPQGLSAQGSQGLSAQNTEPLKQVGTKQSPRLRLVEPAPRLGMIEQAMYDAFMHNPQEARELETLAQEHPLETFTAMLQARYSEHASYITPERVSHVMSFIAREKGNTEQSPIERVKQALNEYPTCSDRELGRLSGLAPATAKKYRAQIEQEQAQVVNQ